MSSVTTYGGRACDNPVIAMTMQNGWHGVLSMVLPCMGVWAVRELGCYSAIPLPLRSLMPQVLQ